MKTIEERAHYCADWVLQDVDPADALLFRKLIVESYSAGAIDEQKELLRWRDPEKEFPEEYVPVLGKTSDVQHPFVIMRYLGCRWLVWAYPGWAGPSGKVIGWRPIHENE